MKKGISVWSFSGGSLYDIFKLAKRAGFEGVEVALDESGELSLNSTEEEILKVRKMADQTGISLYSVASGLYWKYSLTSNDQKIREKAKSIVKKQIETAELLGCDTILVVPGAVGADFIPGCELVEYDTAYDRALTAMRELSSYAEQCKVTIGVENVWNKFLLSPLEMRDFIDKIGSDFVGAYFDVGNVLFSGYPEHWIKILGNRIKKVHFKDYKRAIGTVDGFVDLLSGDVDYPAVMRALENAGYDGWVTGELNTYKSYPQALLYNASFAMNQILGRNQND